MKRKSERISSEEVTVAEIDESEETAAKKVKRTRDSEGYEIDFRPHMTWRHEKTKAKKEFFLVFLVFRFLLP